MSIVSRVLSADLIPSRYPNRGASIVAHLPQTLGDTRAKIDYTQEKSQGYRRKANSLATARLASLTPGLAAMLGKPTPATAVIAVAGLVAYSGFALAETICNRKADDYQEASRQLKAMNVSSKAA